MQQEQSLLIGHIMDIYNDAKLEIYTLVIFFSEDMKSSTAYQKIFVLQKYADNTDRHK